MMVEKECRKCNVVKPINEYGKKASFKSGYNSRCKACVKEQSDIYIKNNLDIIKEKRRLYYLNNKENFKSWGEENKKHREEYLKGYYKENKVKLKSKSNLRYHENRDEILGKQKKYFQDNKEKINKFYKKKKKTDVLFRLSCNIRCRISNAFKRRSWHKDGGSETLLGCSFKEAKQHIESQFIKGMSWDNYGEWHIDHIIPLAFSKTEDEMIKLCNYNNLQPLWADDNYRKGKKLITRNI